MLRDPTYNLWICDHQDFTEIVITGEAAPHRVKDLA